MSEQQPYPAWGPPAGPAPYPSCAPYPQTPQVPPGTNGSAKAGLVFGIIPFMGGLLGVVFGAIGLSQTRRTGQRGRGMATAGLVLGIVWVLALGGAVVAGVLHSADRDDTGAVAEAGTGSAYDLAVGDCLPTVPTGDAVDTVDLVPCAEQHTVEVFAEFDLPDGRYPGEDRVTELAETGCVARFRGFAGVDLDGSRLDVQFLTPLERGWELDHDRSVTCLAVTGSADETEGAGGTLGA